MVECYSCQKPLKFYQKLLCRKCNKEIDKGLDEEMKKWKVDER